MIFLLFIWATSYLGQKIATKSAFKAGGRSLYYLFASFGVVCHESSHALVAIIFGHKVGKVSFFNPDPHSPTLGYVQHSYNPNSHYQLLGSFFIGFAPLFLAPLFIYAMSALLLPNYTRLLQIITFAGNDDLLTNLPVITSSISVYFTYVLTNNPLMGLLWLFVSSSIALSCGPSPADIKNARKGLLHFLAVLFLVTFLLGGEIPLVIKGGYILILGLCLLQVSFFLVLRIITRLLSSLK